MTKDFINEEYKDYCEVTKMHEIPPLSFEDFLILRLICKIDENEGLVRDYDCIVKEKDKLEIKLKVANQKLKKWEGK